MKRDHETLRQVGEALYGPLWQSAVGRAVGVGDRMVRYWAAGERPIPDGVWRDLATVCAKRGAALQKWAERLTV